MMLPALDMPDDPQLIPGWLERHLMGLELGELVAELEAAYQADLAEATPVDAMTLDARPLASRVLDNACRLFTPIL